MTSNVGNATSVMTSNVGNATSVMTSNVGRNVSVETQNVGRNVLNGIQLKILSLLSQNPKMTCAAIAEQNRGFKTKR